MSKILIQGFIFLFKNVILSLFIARITYIFALKFFIKGFCMVKLYGIKTCGSVKKAMQFLDSKGIEYTFIDFKKEAPNLEKIGYWLKFVPLKTLCNSKGTTYKKLGLKDKNLEDNAIKQWLIEAPLLIKRPVIEYVKESAEVIVGFDEDLYRQIWG